MERLISIARGVAIHAHRDQFYNGNPYAWHLDHVVSVLVRFGVSDPEILCAGYLHDTVEDTNLTVERIATAFTPRIASLVDAVTDGKGENRRERKKRPYALIPGRHGALEIKLADRIANVEAALATSNSIILMYAKEHPELVAALGRAGAPPHLDRMWKYLAHLL